MDHFLRINEESNARDSLGKANEFLKNIKTDPLYWKWFIMAIHHAIYDFMLLALKNSDLSGIWEEPVRFIDNGPNHKYIDIDNPNNKLINFLDAFKLIQKKEKMSGSISAKPFIANIKHRKAIKKLNGVLRNNFMHFSPKLWSIEILFMIETVFPLLEIIEFLVFDSGRFFIEEKRLDEIRSNLDSIRSLFKSYKIDLNKSQN